MENNVFIDTSSFDNRSVTTGVEDNEFARFLVEGGLYETIEVTPSNVLQLSDLLEGYVKLNVFCPECNDTRVFSSGVVKTFYVQENFDVVADVGFYDVGDSIFREQRSQAISRAKSGDKGEWNILPSHVSSVSRVLVISFVCAMRGSHHLDFILSFEGNNLRKIGQYPSVADLDKQDFDSFGKVMSKEDKRELKRAVGLNASGIGIGSFVYLRRVFERMIETAANEAIASGEFTEDDLQGVKEKEKIKLLSEYLPDMVVDNKVFYGIVSKGIHELSEEECLEYFPVLYSFLMMIFEEKEVQRKREQRKSTIKSSLNAINSVIA